MKGSRGLLLLVVGALALGLVAPPVGARATAPAAPAAAEPVPLPQLRPVRMGMILALGMTPVYLARERGYFAAEGIDLQYEPVQVTSEAIAQVATGHLEVANVTVGAAVLNSVARGVDIKIIAGNDGYPPSGPGGNPFLVRKDLYDAGVTDANGLRGRRVGGNARGVFTEYGIDRAMRTAGMTVDDIDFVTLPFPDIPAALANRVIDAAFVAEPSGTVAIMQGTAVEILHGFLAGAQQTVLVGGPTLLGERALAEAYLRAYLRGVRAAQAEGFSPEVAAIVEKYTRVSAELVQRIRLPYWDRDGRVNWDSLMDQQRFYIARGATTYTEPLDLQRALSEDGPRQAAVGALGRE